MSGETIASFCLDAFCVMCWTLVVFNKWAKHRDAEKDRKYRLALYALRDYWEGRALNTHKPESAERTENAE